MAASGEDPMQVDETPKPIVAPAPLPPASSAYVAPKVEAPRASSVPARMSNLIVGYVYSAEMTQHFLRKNPAEHVEQPERITRIYEIFVANRYNSRMKWLPIRPVQKLEALLVHTEDHWNKVLAFKTITDQQIIDTEAYYEQLSLYVMQGTTRAALLSCGGVIEACLSVARNELKKAVAIVRPPGHHAEPEEHMGFCFFNNVAVAARVVQNVTPLKKILILDWDVHHGNGTHRAFIDDPSVLYISLHRYEAGQFYPCGPLGSVHSCGEGPGLGYCVNIPWPEGGMGDADYIYAFQKIVLPIAAEFAPELVIISAGFDAAVDDPLGECRVTPAGYAHMTHMLSGLAGGRLVVALEGGYNIESTANSMISVIRTILGEAPPELPPLHVSESGTETVWLVAKEQSKYWKYLDVKSCEPQEEYPESTRSIGDILKEHRRYHLITNYDIMEVPLVNPEMDKRFSAQIFCSGDLFEKETLVVFAHEFGNLRAEMENSLTCDVKLENSYLIDFSKALIEWIVSSGYSLLDVNLYSKPYVAPSRRHQALEDVGRDLMTYLWDNYVQLHKAERIILIGHGPGCQPLMDLINARSVTVMKQVKAVVQVCGMNKLPMTPKRAEDMQQWYTKRSLIAVPINHPVLGPLARPKDLKRHGDVVQFDETQPAKLIMRALPAIKEYVKQALHRDTPGKRMNI